MEKLTDMRFELILETSPSMTLAKTKSVILKQFEAELDRILQVSPTSNPLPTNVKIRGLGYRKETDQYRVMAFVVTVPADPIP